MIFICTKCKTENEHSEKTKTVICKKCKKKYYNNSDSADFIRVKGQLVRKTEK